MIEIDRITYLCLKYNVNGQTYNVKCKFIMLVDDNARLHFVSVNCYMVEHIIQNVVQTTDDSISFSFN